MHESWKQCVFVYVKGAGGCLFEMDIIVGFFSWSRVEVPGSIAKGLFHFNSLHKSHMYLCINTYCILHTFMHPQNRHS